MAGLIKRIILKKTLQQERCPSCKRNLQQAINEQLIYHSECPLPHCAFKAEIRQAIFNSKTPEVVFENNNLNGTILDFRDNYEYKWTRIGNQIWLAENLRFNLWIHEIISTIKKIRINESQNRDEFFYNLSAAKQCVIPGWHIPSKEEFEILLNNYEYNSSVNLNNMIKGGLSGFNAEFLGYFSLDYILFNKRCSYWTSTYINGKPIVFTIAKDPLRYFFSDEYFKDTRYFNVRLIKDF